MHSLSQTCNMHVCSMVILLTYSTRLNVPNVSPTGPTLVLTHVRTLGGWVRNKLFELQHPPFDAPSNYLQNIFYRHFWHTPNTNNAKAIYTFKFTILKHTSVSNAIQKIATTISTLIQQSTITISATIQNSTTTISELIPSDNAIYKFDSITVITIIWDPAVAPV